MVVLHWLFSPGVYLWIENAPIAEAAAPSKTETAPAEANEVEKFEDKKVAESTTETASNTMARPTQRTIAEETDDFSWAM